MEEINSFFLQRSIEYTIVENEGDETTVFTTKRLLVTTYPHGLRHYIRIEQIPSIETLQGLVDELVVSAGEIDAVLGEFYCRVVV